MRLLNESGSVPSLKKEHVDTLDARKISSIKYLEEQFEEPDQDVLVKLYEEYRNTNVDRL